MVRAFDIEPLDATFGAMVTGVKLAALDDAAWHELHAAWLTYALHAHIETQSGRDARRIEAAMRTELEKSTERRRLASAQF
ncbi:MAG TPA: hypothetical protein VNF27_02210 [Candidatus Binataceae bacterium]|nr:hypothetical protein [Candidatus Binataceae bacterium]